MMKITRRNYESWLIDFIDGNLSDEQVDMVLDFLLLNPDINEEFKNFEKILLEPEQQNSFPINKLLKTDFDHPEIFEETAIRSIENQLSEKETIKFDHYLSNSTKARKEFNIFLKTVLKPDETIVYPHKNKLIKKRIMPLYWLSAAAVIVFAVLFWFNNNNQQNNPQQQIAKLAIVLPAETTMPPVLHFKPTLNQFDDHVIQSEAKSENIENTAAIHKNDDVNIALMNSLTCDVLTNNNDIQLAQISKKESVIQENVENFELFPTVKELLAEKVNNKVNEIDPENELSRFKFLALNRINSATNQKFDYAVNDEGQVNRIGFNSRLISVSIPINNSK